MADLRKKFEFEPPKWSASALRWIGLGCMAMGTFSIGVLQRVVIDLESYNNQTLYEAIAPGGGLMGIATVAVLFQLLSYAAIPIYAWLLYEGWRKTENQWIYLGRLLLLALAAEIPFDFAMTGAWLDMSRQNPVWALALSLLMLGIFRQYDKAGLVLKILVALAAAAWAVLLQSYMGVVTVLFTTVFVLLEKQSKLRTAVAVAVGIFQFPAALGMFAVHWYDGTPGETPKYLHYILYPVMLLAMGLLAAVLG